MPEKDETLEEESPSRHRGETPAQDDAAALDEAERRAIRARASPEGIVTILFTDVVQSTRLRERLGDETAQELFREHDRLVRDQIGMHGGFEVKHTGDGFMVAFSSVVGALACAVDIQEAITEHNRVHPGRELQVRIGLNCGQTIKEGEDFFGSAVVAAARITNLAKPRQILVSETVRGLAGSRQEIRYVRHGRHRLKGLDGTYDVWSVPWREAEVGGFARLWAKPVLRLTVLVLLLAAIGGGVAGGVVLSQAGGGGGAAQPSDAFEEIAFHFDVETRTLPISGDCLSEDLVHVGPFEGEATGDVPGRLTGMSETTFYAAESCQLGLFTNTFTITDANENTVSGILEGPLSSLGLPEEGEGPTASAASALVATFTGGTGIYENATGRGACSMIISAQIQPDGSAVSNVQGDCTGKLATSGEAGAALEPVIVQVGASPTEVTVFGGSRNLPNTVALAVLYRNTREQAQTGLSVRLPVPEGTEILAAARGEKQPASAGERIWSLPDLPPGELQRFEFSLQFLAADAPAIPLVVEVEGDGFEEPVASDPVTIRVVQ